MWTRTGTDIAGHNPRPGSELFCKLHLLSCGGDVEGQLTLRRGLAVSTGSSERLPQGTARWGRRPRVPEGP